MRRLGLSIYPDKSSLEEIKAYLKAGSERGFSRIFTCLLSVNKDKDALIDEFSSLHDYAHDLGYEVIADVAPRVFDALGLKPDDLSFFKAMKVDGLRLDRGFSGFEEALMTYNEQGLKIEINMSNDVSTIETIMDYKPNVYQLYACHNFYPHGYSGLDLDFFEKCTKRFKAFGLHTAAFITSQEPNTFGPWPTADGLPTLEMHRHLPIDVQAKHMVSLERIDDILISNCFPSTKELDALAKVNLSVLNLDVELVDDVPENIQSIVFDELHINRGDQSPCLIRSSRPRETHAGEFFALFHAPKQIKRGDVIVESSEYGSYAGELQIALTDMENTGKSNVVGRIKEQELFLIDTIKPWQKFVLTRSC